MNVFLGFLLLNERLRKLQWLAVGLAIIGVSIQIIALGYLPWASLTLALTFSCYGLCHKHMPTDSLSSLFIETLLLLPMALLYLFWLFQLSNESIERTQMDWLLLLLAGPVTTIPLLLFSNASKRLLFSTLGFFQYIGPSIMFILAIFAYGEPLIKEKFITFLFIWVALIIYTLDATKQHYQNRSLKKTA